MAYVSLDEFKRELALLHLPLSSDDDGLLQQKLDDAQRTIENVTRRFFEAEADEERLLDYTLVNGRNLYLPYDLCGITEIVNGDGTVIGVDEYVTMPRFRSISGGACVMPNSPQAWPWYEIVLKQGASVAWTYTDSPEEAIAITGRWAFSVTPPADIVGATLRLASWFYQQKDSLADRKDSMVSRSGSLLLMADLPLDVQRRLLRYVRLV
ncbi:MAG: phage gp6-like head-tail connector protein [Anaerolinea sp.]|nr:phage gp6-like head-tail connector protein [Anaerolinea sp.]